MPLTHSYILTAMHNNLVLNSPLLLNDHAVMNESRTRKHDQYFKANNVQNNNTCHHVLRMDPRSWDSSALSRRNYGF